MTDSPEVLDHLAVRTAHVGGLSWCERRGRG